MLSSLNVALTVVKFWVICLLKVVSLDIKTRYQSLHSIPFLKGFSILQDFIKLLNVIQHLIFRNWKTNLYTGNDLLFNFNFFSWCNNYGTSFPRTQWWLIFYFSVQSALGYFERLCSFSDCFASTNSVYSFLHRF